MTALQPALDELANEGLACLGDDDLGTSLVELSRVRNMVDAELTRRVGEFDSRGAAERDGHLSTTAWLRHRCRLLAGRARDLMRWARRLRQMAATDDAFRRGDIGTDQVRVLCDAAARHPELFPRDEHVLLEAAMSLGPRDLRRAVDYWTQAADGEAALHDENALDEHRTTFLSRTHQNRWRLDGDLTREGGALLNEALDLMTQEGARDPGDHRSAPQRRHDALTDMARYVLDHHPGLPAKAGTRPHLLVLVDLDTLERRAGKTCETGDGDVLLPDTARRLACDARITRIITRGPSQPLDVGRASRTVTAAQWLALVVRDRHCTWAGCDRPARWCDVHHLEHWVDGGRTDLANLCLLCRRHHRMVHEGGDELPATTLRSIRERSRSLVDVRSAPGPRSRRPSGRPPDRRGHDP